MYKKIVPLFIVLIMAQTAFSFLSPSFGTNDCWKTFQMANNYKGHSLDSFDQKLLNRIKDVIADYHFVCDGGGMVILAHDFPADYFRGRLLFVNRPLYPFLVNLLSRPFHLFSNSFSMTFAAAILANLLLFFVAVLMFFILVKKIFSERVALWSAILLIFSPFAHSWLIQPEANVLGVFSLMLSLFLLYNYIIVPKRWKLVVYSLVVGILMLGKMNLAIGLFILLIALWHRKFKEAAIFIVFQFIPLVLWYVVVKWFWGLGFGMQEVSNFGVGIWILEMAKRPAYQIAAELLSAIPSFFTAVIYGFFPVPIIFSYIGYRYAWNFEKKALLYWGMAACLLVFFFVMRIYLPRHAFWLFPMIYPTAVLGIDKAAEWLQAKNFCRPFVFRLAAYLLIIAPACLDVLKMYGYLNVPYS